jgi:hypothetical protein
MQMMTRGQVARRLGKSIATVRRLEGTQLHPRRDVNGILRFDPNEVERVARALGRGGRTTPAFSGLRSAWFYALDDDEVADPEEAEHRERLRKLEAEANAAAEARRAANAERLRREGQEDAEQLRELQLHAARQLSSLSALIKSCSPRELRILSRDPEISVLLRTLSRGW